MRADAKEFLYSQKSGKGFVSSLGSDTLILGYSWYTSTSISQMCSVSEFNAPLCVGTKYGSHHAHLIAFRIDSSIAKG